MAVDVLTEIEICPRDHVAAFASDPGNATAWCQKIKSVEWRTSPSVAVGSQIAVVADRGQPAGFAKLAAIAMASAMRRANRKDLRALKTIMGRDAGG